MPGSYYAEKYGRGRRMTPEERADRQVCACCCALSAFALLTHAPLRCVSRWRWRQAKKRERLCHDPDPERIQLPDGAAAHLEPLARAVEASLNADRTASDVAPRDRKRFRTTQEVGTVALTQWCMLPWH